MPLSPEKLREYRLKHKEKHNENKRKWREANPEKDHKVNMKSGWKSRGVVGDLDAIYERWLNTTHCDVCKVSFEGKMKYMDHDHQSGEFRHILCMSCNSHDYWMKVKTSSS
jgi:hypothetical protein